MGLDESATHDSSHAAPPRKWSCECTLRWARGTRAVERGCAGKQWGDVNR